MLKQAEYDERVEVALNYCVKKAGSGFKGVALDSFIKQALAKGIPSSVVLKMAQASVNKGKPVAPGSTPAAGPFVAPAQYNPPGQQATNELGIPPSDLGGILAKPYRPVPAREQGQNPVYDIKDEGRAELAAREAGRPTRSRAEMEREHLAANVGRRTWDMTKDMTGWSEEEKQKWLTNRNFAWSNILGPAQTRAQAYERMYMPLGTQIRRGIDRAFYGGILRRKGLDDPNSQLYKEFYGIDPRIHDVDPTQYARSWSLTRHPKTGQLVWADQIRHDPYTKNYAGNWNRSSQSPVYYRNSPVADTGAY